MTSLAAPAPDVTAPPPSRHRRDLRLFVAVIALAFLVRAALIPLAGFGDLWFLNEVAELIALGGPNLYAEAEKAIGSQFHQPASFVLAYGPAYYYPVAGYHMLLSGLGLENFAACGSACQIAEHPLRWALIGKLPQLFADVTVALVVFRLLPQGVGRRGLLLWIAAPGLFYITYLQGQVDIYPILALLLAVLLLYRELATPGGTGARFLRLRTEDWAMVAIGVGAAVKMIPMLFLPAILVVYARDWRHTGRLAAVSGATFGLVTLPFWGEPLFRSVFLLGDTSEPFIRTRVLNIAPFILGYGIGLTAAGLSGDRRNPRHLLQVVVLVSGLLVVFHHFNPQRGAYLIALLAVASALYPRALAGYLLANLYPLSFGLLSAGLGAALLQHLAPDAQFIPPWIEIVGEQYTIEDGAGMAVTVAAIATAAAMLGIRRGGDTAPAGVSYALTAALVAVPLLLGGLVVGAGVFGMAGRELGSAGTSTGELPGATVREAFKARRDGLNGIDLFVDPLGRGNGHRILLELMTAKGDRVLRSAERGAAELDSGTPQVLRFAFPVFENAADHVFLLRITFPGSTPGNAVGLLTKPSGPQLEVNGQSIEGRLQFRDRYEFPWGTFASDLGSKLRREWLAYLAAGLLAALAAAVLLAGSVWWPDAGGLLRRLRRPWGAPAP